jgi:hypothetical protein
MQYDQQQQGNNDFQRIRPNWNNRMTGDQERFQGRPNPQFARPGGPPNSWNNKDLPRITRDPRDPRDSRDSRDPRMTSDRDPRMRPEPPKPASPTFHAKEALLKVVPPGKEVHPNKLVKQAAAAAAAAAAAEKDSGMCLFWLFASNLISRYTCSRMLKLD